MESRRHRSSRGPQLGDRVVLAISGTVVLIAAGLIINSVSIASSSPLTRAASTHQPTAAVVTQSPAPIAPSATSTPSTTNAPVVTPTTTSPTSDAAQSNAATTPAATPTKSIAQKKTTTAPKPVKKPTTPAKPKPAKTTVVPAKPVKPTSVVALTNQYRAQAGLQPLKVDICLSNNVAQPWALTMSTTGVLQHRDLAQVFPLCPKFSTAGENIALNQRGAAAVVAEWMKSPGHRANILNPKYTHIGVGIHKDAQGRTYWVQNFAA